MEEQKVTVAEQEAAVLVRNRRSSKEKKARRRRNRVLGLLGMCCLMLLAVYIGGRFFFQSHYFPNTRINGVDCSMMNQEDAFSGISDYLSTYNLTIHSEDGDLSLSAEDVGLAYKSSGDLTKILKAQDVDQWFLHLRSAYTFQVMETSLDDAKLVVAIEALACMNPSTPRESENPTLVYNKEKNEYDVVDGAIGNLVNEETFTEAVRKAILAGDEAVDLLSQKYYLPSKYNASSDIIVQAKKKADKYVKSAIHYKDGDTTMNVVGKRIHKFINIDEKYNVTIDEAKVKDYVKNNVAKKFGSGDLVVIDSPGSGKIYVSDGDSGKVVNDTAELKKLLKNIRSGKEVTRKPKYITDYLYSTNGKIVKDDYVDINLSKQKVYVIINGKQKVKTDCVTGNVSAGRSSPTGIYKIAYKTTNYTMVKYNAFVYYWMPYDTTYGIGLHDATWRSSFGGNIYQYDGSHGCINLPLDKARQIYNIVYAGIPVIVHW